jgi:CTP synthase (UTP-ammonia lyase)
MTRALIAVVGDYNPERQYHRATGEALEHAADALAVQMTHDWIPTGTFEDDTQTSRLGRYDAVFLAPGAPYRSQRGAFVAIRFARERGWPFFAT